LVLSSRPGVVGTVGCDSNGVDGRTIVLFGLNGVDGENDPS
jgi:hypothetical protein